ncbi:hypothetical protein PHLCEN_2v13049 [Hermanssonia centrifuga]|uniref:Uncharacterized protein n=1 Tax=Hermanssonia centrifuga TaxID=98765 RepID=A0A2R6NFB9_9APHY|nr:hypothetical protein PHLCEN_2v13049 [Hermanssonia centrifuga]
MGDIRLRLFNDLNDVVNVVRVGMTGTTYGSAAARNQFGNTPLTSIYGLRAEK